MGRFTAAAHSSFKAFKEECVTAFKNFKRYGDIALEIDFADADQKEKRLKKLFKKQYDKLDDFDSEIMKFWNENYVTIISKLSDLIPLLGRKLEPFVDYKANEGKVISSEFFDSFYNCFKDGKSEYCYAQDENFLYVIKCLDLSKPGDIYLHNIVPVSSIITDKIN